MAYDKNNANYQQLTDEEKTLVGRDEQERYDAMEHILDGLSADDLMQMFRDQNSWDGSFDFCDGWDIDEFLSVMVEGKRGSELIDFIVDVANAINDYDGHDYKNAQWGYFNGFDLEIKDDYDIFMEARDYLYDLAMMLVDGTYHIDDIPSEVEDALSLWDMEDNGDFECDDED